MANKLHFLLNVKKLFVALTALRTECVWLSVCKRYINGTHKSDCGDPDATLFGRSRSRGFVSSEMRTVEAGISLKMNEIRVPATKENGRGKG